VFELHRREAPSLANCTDSTSSTVPLSWTSCGCDCSNTGYTGANCETAALCTAVHRAPCENGGVPKGTTAGNTDASCSCDCLTGFEGENCQTLSVCTAALDADSGVSVGATVCPMVAAGKAHSVYCPGPLGAFKRP
jgi:hypothetical protein